MRWFILIFLLFIGAYIFLVLTHFRYQEFFPLSGIQECIPPEQWQALIVGKKSVKDDYREFLDVQIASMLTFTFIIVTGLLIVTYRIRNLPEEFSITRELATIMIIIICQVIVYISIVIILNSTSDFSIENAVNDSKGGNTILSRSRYLYFIAAFQMMILFETGFVILYQTYKPNNIVPFPISIDVINSF